MKDPAILPLSLCQKDLVSLAANANSSIRLKGNISVHALRRALAFIMRRHEGLRMRIVRSNEPQQCLVESIYSYDLPVVCVNEFAEAEERIKSCLLTPADLENDGPMRAELIRVGEDDHVLLLVIHPVAIDAYAVVLILRELLISYDCYVRDQEPSLPSAIRYSDYVLNDARCGERLSDEQVQYWRSVLSGSRHPIPRRESYAKCSVGRLRTMTSSITAIETRHLREFASAANVSMAATLYAIIFLAVWSQYSTEDILATVVYAGRDSRALEALGARTARLFPLRLVVNNKISVAEFAKKMQAAFMSGAIASRAPFTPARAVAQALGESPPAISEAEDKEAVQQGIQLFIDDLMIAARELGLTMPNLSVERVLLDPRLYEGSERDGSSPFVGICLRRDFAIETGRCVTFIGTFCTSAIGEAEVGQLLERMCAIARAARRENQRLAIHELVRMASQTMSEGDQ